MTTPVLPSRIDHPVWSELHPGSGHALRIPYATTFTGDVAVWDLQSGHGPHWLIAGPGGAGKTALMRTAVTELATSEIPTLVLQSRTAETITPFYSVAFGAATQAVTQDGAVTAAQFVDALADEVDARADYLRDHALAAADLPLLVVVIDEFDTLVSGWRQWQRSGDAKTRSALNDIDPIDAIETVLALSRSAGIRLCIGVQRLSHVEGIAGFGADARSTFGTRTTFGGLTAREAEKVWGQPTIGHPSPQIAGRATLTGSAGRPDQGQVWWTPDTNPSATARPISPAEQRLSAALAASIPDYIPLPACYSPVMAKVVSDVITAAGPDHHRSRRGMTS